MKAKWSMYLLLAVFVLIVTGTSLAGPTQIILGVSTTGDVVFTNTGGNVNVTLSGDCGKGPADCLSGFAYYGNLVGDYAMWLSGPGGPPTLGAPTGNLYPIDMDGATLNFSTTIQSYFVNGLISLMEVNGGTKTPTFEGILDITDSNFPGYPIGDKLSFDFTINLTDNPSLEDVYSGKYSKTSGYLSSGQIPPSVPEPGSFLLLGSGVVGIAGLLRRKLGL